MYVVERNLQTDDVVRTFERYSKLKRETAQLIIDFTASASKSGHIARAVTKQGQARKVRYTTASLKRTVAVRIAANAVFIPVVAVVVAAM
jgi:predicted metal-binding protein